MKLQLRISHVRLGGKEFRVMRPAQPVSRMVLYEWDRMYDRDRWLSMYVDHQASTVLTTAWGLAARSPRSLIYLPMQANTAPEGVGGEGKLSSLDLVLLHHSLQFPPSLWKQVRARLGPGRLHTLSVRDSDVPDDSAADDERWHFREFRDHLRFLLAANTLLVVGSRIAFRESGALIRTLIDGASAYLAHYPRAEHYCVELAAGPGPSRELVGRRRAVFTFSTATAGGLDPMPLASTWIHRCDAALRRSGHHRVAGPRPELPWV